MLIIVIERGANMGFLNKLRERFAGFMAGRYGADQLGQAMVILALAVTVISMLFRIPFLSLPADALLLLVFFRMFSKNRVARAQENALYLRKTLAVRKPLGEWVNRVKNAKKYRYFVCPKCKTRLRVPRGVGNVTITCRSCGEKFDKKA